MPEHRRAVSARAVLFTAGAVLCIVGVAGPQWGLVVDPVTAPGRDIVAVLDASRSMLAQDVLGKTSPNRAGRAKDALLELADYAQRWGGHRLGLVVFAGRAQIVCPLTNDYDHFRTAVMRVDPDDSLLEIEPPENAASGTRIGAALAAGIEMLAERERGHGDVLLISDGDDPAGDAEWRDGIARAKGIGVPVFAIGVGDPTIGSGIPTAAASALIHDGQEIVTKLYEEPLQEIAERTTGAYFGAGTSAIPIVDLFRKHVESRPRRVNVEDTLPVYRQQAGWFFGAAFAFIAFTMLHRSGGTQTRFATVGLSVFTVVALSAATFDDATRAAAEGNAAFERGDFQTAVDCYARAEERITDPGLVSCNKATALYRLDRYRDAELHFLRALESAIGERRPRIHYNAANAIVRQVSTTDVKRLEQAVQHYEQALTLTADVTLVDDIRHNLQLARQLLESARAAKPPSRDDAAKPNDRNQGANATRPDTHMGHDGPGSSAEGNNMSRRDASGNGTESGGLPSPGVGNLPVLPDRDELVHLSSEDTARYLEQVLIRVARERLEHRQKKVPLRTNVKNW